MSDTFFNPKLITGEPLAMPDFGPAPDVAPPPMPMAAPPPAPVFVPKVPELKKSRGIRISADVARKAQGIYPIEQANKQQMIDNAKLPTPTGAWGAPK